VRQLCVAIGLSRRAYYAAQRALSESERRPRASRPGPWATAVELEAGIRRVVAVNPAWGVRKVRASLRREGVVASRKRVWALMRSLGLVLPPVREREGLGIRGQVAVETSNRRWATDLIVRRLHAAQINGAHSGAIADVERHAGRCVVVEVRRRLDVGHHGNGARLQNCTGANSTEPS
jgi:hypothetical protein